MEPDASSDDSRDQEVLTGRAERVRLFLSEVANELKRVTWPTAREVYATTRIVIVLSILFGLYAWSLELLLDRIELRLFTR